MIYCVKCFGAILNYVAQTDAQERSAAHVTEENEDKWFYVLMLTDGETEKKPVCALIIQTPIKLGSKFSLFCLHSHVEPQRCCEELDQSD